MVPRPNQSPENKLIADVIVHAAIVFCGKDNFEILKPFNVIINSPADLKVSFLTILCAGYINVCPQNAYLPTMPDDSLPEVRRAMGGGQYYGNYIL